MSSSSSSASLSPDACERLQGQIDQMSAIIEQNPQNVSAYQARGRLYKKIGRDPEGRADFEKAAKMGDRTLKASSSSSALVNQDAMQLYQQCGGDIKQLCIHLFKNLEVPESAYSLRLMLAQGMIVQGQFDSAVRELNAIIDANQGDVCRFNSSLFSMRSVAYFGVGNIEQAIADIRSAIEVNKKSAPHYFQYACLLVANDQTELVDKTLELGYQMDREGYRLLLPSIERLKAIEQ